MPKRKQGEEPDNPDFRNRALAAARRGESADIFWDDDDDDMEAIRENSRVSREYSEAIYWIVGGQLDKLDGSVKDTHKSIADYVRAPGGVTTAYVRTQLLPRVERKEDCKDLLEKCMSSEGESDYCLDEEFLELVKIHSKIEDKDCAELICKFHYGEISKEEVVSALEEALERLKATIIRRVYFSSAAEKRDIKAANKVLINECMKHAKPDVLFTIKSYAAHKNYIPTVASRSVKDAGGYIRDKVVEKAKKAKDVIKSTTRPRNKH